MNRLYGALLALLPIGAAAMLVQPVYLMWPSKPQTAADITLAYTFQTWNPWVIGAFTLAGAALCAALWRGSRSWLVKVPAVLPVLLLAGMTWAAGVSHVELLMFNALDELEFTRADEATHLVDADMVLGVELSGEARAYPVTFLAYHHIVNDVVGGVPLVATY